MRHIFLQFNIFINIWTFFLSFVFVTQAIGKSIWVLLRQYRAYSIGSRAVDRVCSWKMKREGERERDSASEMYVRIYFIGNRNAKVHINLVFLFIKYSIWVIFIPFSYYSLLGLPHAVLQCSATAHHIVVLIFIFIFFLFILLPIIYSVMCVCLFVSHSPSATVCHLYLPECSQLHYCNGNSSSNSHNNEFENITL